MLAVVPSGLTRCRRFGKGLASELLQTVFHASKFSQARLPQENKPSYSQYCLLFRLVVNLR